MMLFESTSLLSFLLLHRCQMIYSNSCSLTYDWRSIWNVNNLDVQVLTHTGPSTRNLRGRKLDLTTCFIATEL
ncbi:hypothetical protein GGR54DRAFT_622566 [Hypoxylon sp. NC1633]|nr:hypothetical protein GGR54DRAFT_622566 [Hypoxylon sp. NC1633]